MCNRYVSPDQASIERYWHVGRQNPPRWWAAAVYPRADGPFIRLGGGGRELVVGQWGLIPHFAKSPRLTYTSNNARSEELSAKPTFKRSWLRGQRCIIPAESFDEPCWETGRNVWWRFCRADGAPWGLAGLWNAWVDRQTGEIIESYTMLTINADGHPLMGRMHKPDPAKPDNAQDKRSIVPIEACNVDRWLQGSVEEAQGLLAVPGIEVFDAKPIESRAPQRSGGS